MNRRGELERAISRARIGAAPYALYTQLLRRCGNATGEIPDDKWAPKLATLATQAKMSERTAYRALWELLRHGWFARHPGNQHKVAGRLTVGRDCDCAAVPVCQREGCVAPLRGKRGDAHYCSDRCRKAANRQAATANSRDMSRLYVGHVRHIAVTPADSSRDIPQANGTSDSNSDIESSNESKERERPDWVLIWRLMRLVAADPCGGIHRSALAEKLGLTPYSPEFSRAVGIAYRKKRIDVCDRYIVKLASPKETAS